MVIERISVVALAAFLMFFGFFMVETERSRINQEWREAARPVFRSRGMVDITDHATPHDLRLYLDPCSAIDWRERGKLYRCDQTEVVVYRF